MLRSSVTTVIDADPDAVWAILRDFASPDAYLKFITAVRISDNIASDAAGCERTMTMTDGTVFVEVLTSVDDSQRTMHYRMLDGPFPFRDYSSTVTVSTTPSERQCAVEWSATYHCTPESAKDVDDMLTDTVYRPGLDEVRTLVTAGTQKETNK